MPDMPKLNTEHHLDIEIGKDELSEIDFSKDATYGEIKKHVLDKYGLKVSSLYIAQVKRKHGIIKTQRPKVVDLSMLLVFFVTNLSLVHFEKFNCTFQFFNSFMIINSISNIF